MVITTATVSIYVADKLLSQFIKDEGYGGLKKFFFPKKKYKNRLANIIQETITEYELAQPRPEESEKFPFYHSQILFDLLNQHILFKSNDSPLLITEFKNNGNIIVPENENLERFYQIFIEKVNADKELKELFFDENYKTEIFSISESLKDLSTTNKAILEKVQKIETNMNAANIQMQTLKNRFDKTLSIQTSFMASGIAVYAKLEKRSDRKKCVTELKTLLDLYTWVYLHGNISMGKTQLAILTTNLYTHCYWIELKKRSIDSWVHILIQELAFHFGLNVSTIKDIEILIKHIPENSLIVLDDIPKGELNIESLASFKFCLEHFHSRNIKILSTSNFHLHSSIKLQIDSRQLIEQEIPYLTEDEICEIIQSYGASYALADGLKKIIHTTSEGHPVIVNAICIYLDKIAWRLDEKKIIEIFTGNYQSDLEDETYEKIVATVVDEESKDLLYRLKSVIGYITNKDIEIIAAVKPPIKNPFEKIAQLNGLWLQKVKDETYEISPLIKKITNSNLSPALNKAINNALAKNIAASGMLNQFTANKAILYYMNAENVNKAGFIFSLILEEANKFPELWKESISNKFWKTTPLPEGMELFLKSVIRYLQINLFLKEKEDVTYLVEDLEAIVIEASKKNINVAHGAVLLSTLYSDKNLEKSSEYLLLSINHIEQLKEFDTERMLTGFSGALESMIWKNLLEVKTIQEFQTWVGFYSNLSTGQQINSLRAELHSVAVIIFCSKLYDAVSTSAQPDWDNLIFTYETILQFAENYSLKFFMAAAIRFKIRTLIVNKHQPNEAIKIFEQNISKFDSASVEIFFLNDELGRQLHYAGKTDIGFQYLLEAVVINIPPFHTEKLDTLLSLNEIFGKKDKNVAHGHITKAYELQAGNQFVSDVFSAKIIGEYVISLWEINKRSEIFYIADEAVEKLLASYKPTDESQGTIIRFGHILNYYFHIITGRPLPNTDGQPYSEPFRSIFLKNNTLLLDGGYYFEQRKFMLAHVMFQAFEFLNDLNMTSKWAKICLQLNEDDTFNPFSSLIKGMNVFNILEGKYEEAILLEINSLKSINELATTGIDAKVVSPILAKVLENRPLTTFDDFDNFILEYEVNFIIIHAFWKYVQSGDKEELTDFVEWFKIVKNYFQNQSPIMIIETALDYLIDDSKNNVDIVALNNEEIAFATQTKLLLYLIGSFKSDTKSALQMHLAIIQRLEMMSTHMSNAVYHFLVVPFFIDFWHKKITEYKSDFFQHEFMIKKGFPRIENTQIHFRLKALFKILCHHLEVEPTGTLEQWLDV